MQTFAKEHIPACSWHGADHLSARQLAQPHAQHAHEAFAGWRSDRARLPEFAAKAREHGLIGGALASEGTPARDEAAQAASRQLGAVLA
jgi:hypothetical protein